MYVVDVPIDSAAGDSEVVRVQVRELDEGLLPVARPGRSPSVRASRSFGEMLATVRPVAENFVTSLKGMASAPDEVTVQFGISLSTEADVLIASTAAAATFAVSMTWRTSAQEGSAATG
ncbi:CU044_2847 family protein [Streptomyces sp. NBC_00582]|uniref:CU044_2847 family protein n=1 Tax=Streptomyces sp. NBC_00582 TaxID=2975783 RepID=UPI0010E115AE|nr:CU044_2847 family protein [Streptomyces sp. NBC_00582]WUB59128.1 hypothetical protein OG852_01035 [Streptomyces sp. NBC_00582]WUB67600.1 hypothetical protein OG852_48100 [Streptomyces sp. NBC_00582]